MPVTAVVTGAAWGIGSATALLMAQDGWHLVLVDECSDDPRVPYSSASESELTTLGEYCKSAGSPGVLTVVADASDDRRLVDAIAAAELRFGGIDAMVSAGTTLVGGQAAWDMPIEQIDAVMEHELRTVIAWTQATVPALLRRPTPRRGRVIAVATNAAQRVFTGLAMHCAAKAGIAGFIRGLAADLSGTGITANTVSPGLARSPALDAYAALNGFESADDFARHHGVHRLLDPSEIARAIIWIASEASSGMNGADLVVDAGMD